MSEETSQSPAASSAAASTSEAVIAEPAPRLFAGKFWFWVVILPLIALDLWSKAAAFAYVPGDAGTAAQVSVIQESWGGFAFVKWHNTGTIWGLGKDFNIALRVLRCLALGLLIYFAYRTPATKRVQLTVLGMIFAGAVGNLYDNFMTIDPPGGVRDFLLFYANWGGEMHQFPAFNVADSCICVGAFTLAFLLWRQDRLDR